MKTLVVLLRIEWLKTVKRRSFWVAFGAFAVFAAIPAIEAVRRAAANASAAHALPDSWPRILDAAGLGPFFVGALMILLVAPEFTWRTARQNVIDGLSRERIFAGKTILLAGLVLLFMATTVFVGVAGALISGGEGGPGVVRPADLSYMGGVALCFLLAGSGGLMISVLVRSAGPALGVLFLFMVVEEAIGRLVSQAGGLLADAARFLPSNILDELGEDMAHYPEVLAEVNAERAQRGLGPWEFLDVEALAAAALAYSSVFLVVALLNMRSRDL